jgi:anti-anti-sigma factor
MTWDLSGRVGCVSLEGELDLSFAAEVERAIAEAEAKRPKILVLDLRRLSFIDSTGLRIVLATDARAHAAGRRLLVVRGSEPVHRVFRIAMLEDRLEFVDDPIPEMADAD